MKMAGIREENLTNKLYIKTTIQNKEKIKQEKSILRLIWQKWYNGGIFQDWKKMECILIETKKKFHKVMSQEIKCSSNVTVSNGKMNVPIWKMGFWKQMPTHIFLSEKEILQDDYKVLKDHSTLSLGGNTRDLKLKIAPEHSRV